MTLSARQIADLVGGRLLGDGDRAVTGVSAPETASPGHLVFATSDSALAAALAGRAGTVLARSVSALPADRTAVVVADPRLAFARAAAALHPAVPPPAGVHPSAVVDPSASVPPTAHVGPHVAIGARVRLGAGAVVEAGCVLGDDVVLGDQVHLHPRVVLYRGVSVGARTVVQSGAVLGSEGFGFVPTPEGNVTFPQLGGLRIGADVTIGAGCTLDRGALGDTVVGDGTRLDNLVHVGHGSRIGAHCLIAGQSGLAGRAELGDRVHIAGQVGVDLGAHVGDGTQLGSRSWVRPEQRVTGGVWLDSPVAPIAEARRRIAAYRRLPELVRTVRELARRLDALELPATAQGRPIRGSLT